MPKSLVHALRAEAARTGKSLDEVVVAALLRAFDLAGEPPVLRDLSDIVGTWQSDPEMDRVLDEQRRVDPRMWR